MGMRAVVSQPSDSGSRVGDCSACVLQVWLGVSGGDSFLGVLL